MLIAYYSLTGNVRRFVAKTGLAAVEIKPGLLLTEPFVCVTGTYGFGQVAGTVSDFLADNSDYLAGVAASGNRIWADNYAKAADIIAAQYGVPIVGRFELAGTDADVRQFIERVNALDE
ncbi:class Ib ribonucleoside-diphosphate reductase assembly flavoprotein NrdI [Bacillus amyloliquefaciens]|uniref:class Ib ribonucleoside-diphosphate reductase assembly flavoprotein NrdI n=1 Tax=Bacillus amyloliquefaciens TaxID=1390 RepID=UPI0011CC167C|nr:class Ib ribonucleoside-diphosphate reductase assembly flavoprotein NrdI [Bacillus amyloliquefaciens]TXK24522.1 class Ib ribonucleoside-diphosphate reductase assembly flavoprotein NrdI [Bacillus amyloliquefaciens]TXK30737.1 class Ib ribonucleoside-diphosphate reductase assembly flavoprotein NrdI [Bacillus amyloliquefaciens]